MGGDKDRFAFCRNRRQCSSQPDPSVGIQTCRRFVQQQNVRVRKQDPGERDLLLHPLGERVEFLIQHPFHIGQGADPFHIFFALFGVFTERSSHKIQIFPGGHIGKVRECIRHQAGPFPEDFRVAG